MTANFKGYIEALTVNEVVTAFNEYDTFEKTGELPNRSIIKFSLDSMLPVNHNEDAYFETRVKLFGRECAFRLAREFSKNFRMVAT